MKLVIISVPNATHDDNIREACVSFAESLGLTTVKVNILNESDIQVESAIVTIDPIVSNICAKCINPNPLVTVANFWRLISTGEISKKDLEILMKNNHATKAYLRNKKLECFFTLFDDALKRM